MTGRLFPGEVLGRDPYDPQDNCYDWKWLDGRWVAFPKTRPSTPTFDHNHLQPPVITRGGQQFEVILGGPEVVLRPIKK